MEVRILSMYRCDSSLSEIHLHASMMTCLGFVLLSWAISFYKFSREGKGREGIVWHNTRGGKSRVY